MQPEDSALLVLLPVLWSAAISFLPHPSAIRSPILRAFVQVLGRVSFLRHDESPGTLHLPLTAQPRPKDFYEGPRCPECRGRAGRDGKLLHEPWCTGMGPHLRGGPGPALPAAAALLLLPLLLGACDSFFPLAQLARRTYEAAADAEERAADADTKGSARVCGRAARDAVRAAEAAQQALVDKAPGYGALKEAARAAERRMRLACGPLKLDVTGTPPPPAPDMAAPEVRDAALPPPVSPPGARAVDAGGASAAPAPAAAPADLGVPRG